MRNQKLPIALKAARAALRAAEARGDEQATVRHMEAVAHLERLYNLENTVAPDDLRRARFVGSLLRPRAVQYRPFTVLWQQKHDEADVDDDFAKTK
jgi:tRNA isopentenyl-2-thiomethyl-A-37 hydroxylase MiaE